MSSWLGAALPLFDAPDSEVLVPYASGSLTSRQGAEIGRVKAGTQMAELLALYQMSGPLTDHQCEARLGWPIQRVCARRGALVKLGLVDKREVVEGPFGAKNQTWGVK